MRTSEVRFNRRTVRIVCSLLSNLDLPLLYGFPRACTLTEPPVSPVGHCQNKSGIHLVCRRSVHCRSSRYTRIPFSLHDKNFFLFFLRPSARYLSYGAEEKTETVFDEGSGSYYIKLKYVILNLI